MGLEPTGYTAANRRTIKLMVEQAAPLFEDGSAPMFMAMGEAIAAVDVGKLFYAIAPVEEDNAGAKRLYLRTAIAPFYEDMGDDAAPVSTSNFGPTAVTVDRMGVSVLQQMASPTIARFSRRWRRALALVYSLREGGAIM